MKPRGVVKRRWARMKDRLRQYHSIYEISHRSRPFSVSLVSELAYRTKHEVYFDIPHLPRCGISAVVKECGLPRSFHQELWMKEGMDGWGEATHPSSDSKILHKWIWIYLCLIGTSDIEVLDYQFGQTNPF